MCPASVVHCRPARVMYCWGVVCCIDAILADYSDGFTLIALMLEARSSDKTCGGFCAADAAGVAFYDSTVFHFLVDKLDKAKCALLSPPD